MAGTVSEPNVGQKWVSLDPRDENLVVEVIGIVGGYVQIQRFRKTLVRRDRFVKSYRPALTPEDGGA